MIINLEESRRKKPTKVGNPKVLIVEDDYIIAADIFQQLKKLGCDPLAVVSNAEETKILLRQQPHMRQ